MRAECTYVRTSAPTPTQSVFRWALQPDCQNMPNVCRRKLIVLYKNKVPSVGCIMYRNTTWYILDPFTTRNPFLGTKLLGFSIGRGSGALKGLKSIQKLGRHKISNVDVYVMCRQVLQPIAIYYRYRTRSPMLLSGKIPNVIFSEMHRDTIL